MRREYRFYTYIMQSASRRPLYIGMTNNLRKRVWQHKSHSFEGFTDDYNATRLVYWESSDDVHKAIAREKQLKGWRREKKMSLVETMNPRWQDLAADWYEAAAATGRKLVETQGSSTVALGMTKC
jgi:putative endonuclease